MGIRQVPKDEKCGQSVHIFRVGMRLSERGVKHVNKAISAALFMLRMGEGLNRNTNMRYSAKLAALFMFGWGGRKRKGTKNEAIWAVFFVPGMAEGVCLRVRE